MYFFAVAGDGWYLDSILIRSPDGGGVGGFKSGTGGGAGGGGGGGGREYHFPCSRWLDGGKEDQRTVRELYPVEGNTCQYF